MKIYVQTEVQEPTGSELRPRTLVMETGAPESTVRAMLGDISQGLGRMTAIPPVAHEHNLRAILPRDLAARGVAPGSGDGGEVILRVRREPGQTGPAGQAEITALSYEVV
ncbi:MAG TPA: hypothetical protein V6D47_03320 [Oscillatoriaceae cyanobacterium]